MAYSYEGNNSWVDNVYIIETDDPVLGGIDGAANLAVKNLADRTFFLFNKDVDLHDNARHSINFEADLGIPSEDGFVLVSKADGTRSWSNIQGLLRITDTPQISLTSSINENSAATGFIDNFDSDATYWFSSDVGTVDWSGGSSFTFNSFNIESSADVIGTLEVYATKPGELQSETIVKEITVYYVATVAGSGIQIVNFDGEARYNDGFDLI